MSTTSTPVLQILEENNYYPFGLRHKGYNSNINGIDHPYGFGGKEEQNEFNNTLQWLDFGARNYDASLGRWMNIDPLAGELSNTNQTPYHFCSNDPINRFDPDGRDDWMITKDNKFVKIKTTNDKFHRIYKLDREGKKVSFYRTDHKLFDGVEDNGWNRVKKENNRKEFLSLLETSKNKDALKDMIARAKEEDFFDAFDILIMSTESLQINPTDRGDPDRYSFGFDLIKSIKEYFEKKDEKEKEKRKKKRLLRNY
ncbi:RHS repeat domain-containing protein [Mariniflexile rhizosphaerae]|uniref:RHS repeat domain-containing protein n=1 Tax=unclassified Mariniflexile TaxID=2643887 RepID=UPI0013C2FF6D|nr:RHS repeat-associated core domain-containing protein [Mariniflexile sp. TRM1-10]